MSRLVAKQLVECSRLVAKQLVECSRLVARQLVECSRLVARQLVECSRLVARQLVECSRLVARQWVECSRLVARQWVEEYFDDSIVVHRPAGRHSGIFEQLIDLSGSHLVAELCEDMLEFCARHGPHSVLVVRLESVDDVLLTLLHL